MPIMSMTVSMAVLRVFEQVADRDCQDRSYSVDLALSCLARQGMLIEADRSPPGEPEAPQGPEALGGFLRSTDSRDRSPGPAPAKPTPPDPPRDRSRPPRDTPR